VHGCRRFFIADVAAGMYSPLSYYVATSVAGTPPIPCRPFWMFWWLSCESKHQAPPSNQRPKAQPRFIMKDGRALQPQISGRVMTPLIMCSLSVCEHECCPRIPDSVWSGGSAGHSSCHCIECILCGSARSCRHSAVDCMRLDDIQSGKSQPQLRDGYKRLQGF
jgi:hypothetical protein